VPFYVIARPFSKAVAISNAQISRLLRRKLLAMTEKCGLYPVNGYVYGFGFIILPAAISLDIDPASRDMVLVNSLRLAKN